MRNLVDVLITWLKEHLQLLRNNQENSRHDLPMFVREVLIFIYRKRNWKISGNKNANKALGFSICRGIICKHNSHKIGAWHNRVGLHWLVDIDAALLSYAASIGYYRPLPVLRFFIKFKSGRRRLMKN